MIPNQLILVSNHQMNLKYEILQNVDEARLVGFVFHRDFRIGTTQKVISNPILLPNQQLSERNNHNVQHQASC